MTVYKVLRCPECGNTDLDGGPCEEPECENYGYFIQWCPKCYWDECNGPMKKVSDNAKNDSEKC